MNFLIIIGIDSSHWENKENNEFSESLKEMNAMVKCSYKDKY